MKKFLFIALAAAGMLTSCSSDDAISTNGIDANNPEGPVAIQIGMGNATAITRGFGTVGDTAQATNVWNGQQVNIFMFKKDTLDLAMNGANPLFDNEFFNTPTGYDGTDTIAIPTDSVIRFYPANGNFDFWGYYLDDAANSLTAGKPSYTINSDTLKIPFTIDGSQDIMGGKAGIAVDTTGTGINDDFFSAKAVRKAGVQPHIPFNHLLTRLTFAVKPGNDITAADSIIIDDVKVVSKNTGDLFIVAKNGAAAELNDTIGINWNAAKDTLALKADSMSYLDPMQRADFDSLKVMGGTTYQKVGEALLVAPGETEYDLLVYMHQIKNTHYNAPLTPMPVEIEPLKLKVKLANNEALKAGYSYNVKMIVYGIQEIEVYTELVKWEDGGDIELDPDNMD